MTLVFTSCDQICSPDGAQRNPGFTLSGPGSSGSEVVNISKMAAKAAVIPAEAGIQVAYLIDFQSSKPYELDSGFRRNDGFIDRRHFFTAAQEIG